jgi:two-component system cell cycle response regulator
MFDLDHFKAINDNHGHLSGDAVLAAIGARMRAVLRGSDMKCRYGGEEFLVLLPDTPIGGARRVAENLRRDIEKHPVRWKDADVPVTASFGVTEVLPGEIDPLAVMARADGALYVAKQQGRNCVRDSETREVHA